ncbi:hypothetical protein ACFVP8_20900 [Viridibacillus arvi]|uniref:hypothetical protein n=1 Tax=Viridibacillus arvi TaxID=263475 RepID=UPI0036CD70B1
MLKKTLVSISISALFLGIVNYPISTYAAASDNITVENNTNYNLSLENDISLENRTLMKSFSDKGVFEEFVLNENNQLDVKTSIPEITNRLGLNSSEEGFLQTIIVNASEIQQSTQKNIVPLMSVSHGSTWVKLTLSNDDVKMYLFAAASIGPTAMYAAVVGLGSIIGPAGTVFTAVIGLLGAASLTNLCYLSIQAVAKGKGLYFEVGMDGFWPYITQGLK